MSHTLLLALPAFLTKDLLVTIIIGFVAGLLAQFITPGRGFGIITTIILGIIGGWIGNKFFTFINVNFDFPYINQILRATLGGIILCIVINLVLGKDKKDKTGWKAV